MSYGSGARGYGGYYNRNTYNSNSSFAKPVEAGKEYNVRITETSRRGDGIAKIQGFVVFVKNGKVGQEDVKIKVNSVGNRFAIAETVVEAAASPAVAAAPVNDNPPE
ncbi:MAG TPA: TRAM domain-containing protein [Nitrososphaeraceae archaeon]